MEQQPSPWQGFFVQCDPKTGQILCITICSQSLESNAVIQGVIDTFIGALACQHVSGN